MNDTANLFLLAGIWSLVAIVAVRLIPTTWPARIAVFALLVGVPFWELPYGFHYFQQLCKDEGKLRMFESISPQKSVCVDYPFDASAKALLRFGFASVESRSKTGEVTQHVGGPLEALPPSKTRIVTSEYCVTFANNNRLPWRVIRHDFLILRSKDGAVIGRHSVFDWFGMWWQEAASPVLGRGGECREDPIQPVMAALRAGSK